MDKQATLRVAAELDSLSRVRRFVEETAAALGARPQAVSDVLLATDEAAANIILHGYRQDAGMIEIELRRRGDALVVFLRDQAPPFDPRRAPPPDLSLPLERRPIGGLGVFIMKELMDEMTYRVMPQGGNELMMIKRGIV